MMNGRKAKIRPYPGQYPVAIIRTSVPGQLSVPPLVSSSELAYAVLIVLMHNSHFEYSIKKFTF